MQRTSLAAARWQLELPRSWASTLFLGLLPLGLMVAVAVIVATTGSKGSDFATFWQSGHMVLHGKSPYPSLQSLPAVANRVTFDPFVYPPPAAFAMVPLSLLPFPLANVLFVTIGLACIALALRLLDVRDWRCYGAAYLSLPVFAAVGNGTVSPLLLLGVAAAWRYRGQTIAVAALIAALVALKLFLWPLWLWLLFTRRFAATVLSVTLAAVGTVLGWALIGFAGFREYPHLLGRLTKLVGPKSYSVYALERTTGVSSQTAQLGLVALGLLLLGVVVGTLGRRRQDEHLFVAALAGALLLTPILWPHYLVLLFVPIALARRTLSALWFMPVVFWLDGATWSNGHPALIATSLTLAALTVLFALQRRGRVTAGVAVA
ncbi:MAG TPA: glycosyltransferase family 87 protein [Gaiellaceae bacterium]|jgi:hypothetical protein